MVAQLRASNIRVADPEYVARTAWTTDELTDAIAAARPRGPYRLVTLQIGVNDQYRARPVRAFTTEFKPLFQRAVRLAGGKSSRLVAVSVPDWGATPFAQGRDGADIARSINEYNEHARRLVGEGGATWVDVTSTSRRMQSDPALVVSDGLHPSAEMYRQWAALVLPAAIAAIEG